MTLKKMQKTFATQCEKIVERCKNRSSLITRGHLYDQVANAQVTSAAPTSQAGQPPSQGPATSYNIMVPATLPEDIQGIVALAQNELIQEWHGYLDTVFEEALKECLSKSRFHPRLPPKMKVELSDVSWGTKPKMIESVCLSLREPFAFLRYRDKISILARLFNVQPGATTEFAVNKHVMIRNVLQHNHGNIRPGDLEDIGRKGQTISVLDENGRERQLGSGHKVLLFIPEIEALAAELKNYSSYFEKLT